jgi:hypothetical protein
MPAFRGKDFQIRTPPQLATKTEQLFNPQEGGRSSAIDICVFRKAPSSTVRS